MLNKRFMSMTQFRKKNAWLVSRFKLPMILTSNRVPLVAIVKVTPELLEQIEGEETEEALPAFGERRG